MRINCFKLERYFAQHEFTAEYLLSSSDCDGYELKYVLDNASKEELELWQNISLGYTESAGNVLLREAILQFYKIKNIENVVVASPGELNFIAMNVLLHPGDHVITISPCYQSLSEVVKALECSVSYWKPNPDTWEFNTSDLEALLRDNTRLIIINFPHNPTGSYIAKDQLEEIVALARRNNAYIFSDEMYHKLIYGDTRELPPIADIYEKGISLWGTSKTFGMAGLRTGWLVSGDSKFIQEVVSFKDYLSICNSVTSEILSVMALNNIDRFLIPNIQKIEKNIRVFQEFSFRNNLVESFIPPKAGSVAFVKLRIEKTAIEFSKELIDQTGIMTVPSEMFGYPGKYIRVGFGRENLPDTLSKLQDYL